MREIEKIDGRTALRQLARRWPHTWAHPRWHVRRIDRYLNQVEATLYGANLDLVELAASCRRDADLTETPDFRRAYRKLARLFAELASLKDRL